MSNLRVGMKVRVYIGWGILEEIGLTHCSVRFPSGMVGSFGTNQCTTEEDEKDRRKCKS